MERIVSDDTLKRYKIFRSTSTDLSSVPPDLYANPRTVYAYVGTVDVNKRSAPEFIDTLNSFCTEPGPEGIPYYSFAVRYRVQAIDKYQDSSVLSDFAGTVTWDGSYIGPEEGRPLLVQDDNLPREFSLRQNYPNPFNPVTKIEYDLPFDNSVSIKVYDILGKEVITLVKEFQNAGRYKFSFNGSNLASGIYYYKIKAGNFESIRKMILIK